MKKNIILLITGLLATASITGAANTNGTSGATLSAELTIEETTSLSFGKVEKSTIDSVISLNSDGSATVSSGDFIHHGGHSKGVFKLIGDANRTVSTITVDATGTLTDGSNTLNATYSIDGTPPATLDSTGELVFSIIGTVSIPASTLNSKYTGTYNITYSY